MSKLKSSSFIVFMLISSSVWCQALRDINYNYLYSLDDVPPLQIRVVRNNTNWDIHYKLSDSNPRFPLENFVIEWGTRNSLNEKESLPLAKADTTYEGTITLPRSAQTSYIVAKLIDRLQKRAWIFYETLDPNHLVNAVLIKNNKIVFDRFVNTADSLMIEGMPSATISYYNDVFPPAQPPFSEAQGKVSREMKADSTFVVQGGTPIQFGKKGLYLIQSDTNATSGFTVRADEDYPKYSKIANLAPPFVFITTAQENNRLSQAKNDKKVFDRIVLNITNDAERAKRLMKNYFKRVEVANRVFSSYKEGWKTDRGMMYIVYGLPDEVFKFNDREVWNYRLTNQNLSFSFVKAGSVFDPENYVLLRDNKYQQSWYETIDLWRGSRF